MTLMRTHSAPPDEHAGNFELGGNGVRATTNALIFSGRSALQVSESSLFSSQFQTSDAPEHPKPSASAEVSGNGSRNSLPEEKQLDEKPPETPPIDRSVVTLAQPIQFSSPYYLDVQRGYSSQPQLTQQLPPQFSPQTRLMAPRGENGERNKMPSVLPVQLPPRMPPPLMPQYFNLSPPLQMMAHQARPLGSIPLQAPMYQPQMMYPVFSRYISLLVTFLSHDLATNPPFSLLLVSLWLEIQVQ